MEPKDIIVLSLCIFFGGIYIICVTLGILKESKRRRDEINNKRDSYKTVYSNGDTFWYKNDNPHRTDGPAIKYANGDIEWWLEGEQVTEKDVMGF